MPLNPPVSSFPLSTNGVILPPILSGNLISSNKPSLTKVSAVDIQDEETKKLSRGISRTAENAGVISQICSEVCASLAEVDECFSNGSSSVHGGSNNHQVAALEREMNDCTFTLPDLSTQSDEFRAFLENELIDTSMSISLQEAARLNWWTCLGEGCERLWPLSTTGDGNCLLHAASLGMWGFHDRLLILRKALHACLTTGSFRHALWRRWRWQNARSNLQAGLDLFLNEDEWQREWDNILKLASSQPRTSGSSTPAGDTVDTVDGTSSSAAAGLAEGTSSCGSSKTYESLEEIHVLALAHVLKRPIFVIADTVLKDVNGEALAPVTFGGIYLPLEIEPSECSRSPLVLAYDAAHFSALVAMAKKKTSPTIESDPEPPAVIPLVDVDRDLLPIQFEVDPGEACVWNRDEVNESVVHRIALTHEDRLALLNQFLDLVDIPCPAVVTKSSSAASRYLPKVKNDHKANGLSGRPPHDEGWSSDGEFNGRGGGTGGKPPGKQLHSVAKQFGSLGRSVGRKIKRNLIDNFSVNKQQTSASQHLPAVSRLNNQWECPDFILCARLHTEKSHPCLEKMINNYMMSARSRFEQQQSERQKQTLVWQRRKQHTLAETALQEGPSPCINPNCTMYGTAVTSYMCTACYARQLEQEEERVKSLKVMTGKTLLVGGGPSNHNALYGAGKSVFYAATDSQSYADAAKIPATKPPGTGQQNGTLYLSNSTFYGETPIPKGEKVVFEKIGPLCYEKSAVKPVSPVGSRADHAEKKEEVNCLRSEDIKPPERPEAASLVVPQPTTVRPGPVAPPVQKKPADPASPAAVSAAVSAAVAAVVSPSPSRLLSHYDTIRKPCKSSGCTSYGMAGTNWFCPECYHIRRKAALARESILEGMKAAQLQ